MEYNTRELGRCCCRVAISLLTATIIFSSIQVSAEELPSEEDYLGEVPVVLSVTRLKQPRADAPASITIIDRKMIEASGAQEIPDLLRLVPGFQVGHLSDGRVTVTYHGLSDSFARRMQVLVDGRSVYSPVFGGINWPDLPLALEDIERIEIIRGPNSVTYGSNSFLAVVNIITRHSTQDHGHTGLVTGGDIGTKKALYRFGGISKRFMSRRSALQTQGIHHHEQTGTGHQSGGQHRLQQSQRCQCQRNQIIAERPCQIADDRTAHAA